MHNWYYENHGKAVGPVSTLELVKKIQAGELKLIDLVFKEGDGQWMPAEHFSDITSLIKTAGTQFQADADWVVLRTIEVDGRNQYDQIGPFTIEQVLQLLDKGTVKFTDFVWRNGYENWVPLGQLDKFENPLESSVRIDMSIYEKPRTDDLFVEPKAPKFFKPTQKIKPVAEEPKPEEAKGEDLAKDKWAPEPPTKKEEPQRVVAPVAEVVVAPPKRRKEDTVRKQQLEVAKSRWSSVASAVAAFVFLCGASLFVFFGHKAYRTQQVRSSKISFEPVAAAKPYSPKPPAEPIKTNKPAPPPPVVEKVVEKAAEKAKEPVQPVSEFAQMSTKQKSFYFHNERLFLFYSSQKGTAFVNEVEKILRAPANKKKPSQKSQLESWVARVQGFHKSVSAEGRTERLYPDLYKRLSSVTQQLNERAQDLRSQLMSGRAPSKEWTLQEVSVEYKKLFKLAQDLD